MTPSSKNVKSICAAHKTRLVDSVRTDSRREPPTSVLADADSEAPELRAWAWKVLNEPRARQGRASAQSQDDLPLKSAADAVRMVFDRYDVDRDGTLGVVEFGALLCDNQVDVDYATACQAVELVAGPAAKGVSFEGFRALIAHAKNEQEERLEDDTSSLLRDVFDAYDMNRSGRLEVGEYARLLADLGRAPKTKRESEELGELIASCRNAGAPGPLSFQEFLEFAWRIESERQ